MSINRKELFTMKSVHIYLCCFYLCTLTFIFCIENLLFTLFLFHRRKRIVCFLIPSPQEKYYKGIYFVGLAVVVFFTETVQNQIGTQHQSWIDSWLNSGLGENAELNSGWACLMPPGLGLRGWSHATRHRHFSKQTFIFTKSSAFHNANIFVVIPICVSQLWT